MLPSPYKVSWNGPIERMSEGLGGAPLDPLAAVDDDTIAVKLRR
jgi:hypothetical protein